MNRPVVNKEQAQCKRLIMAYNNINHSLMIRRALSHSDDEISDIDFLLKRIPKCTKLTGLN